MYSLCSPYKWTGNGTIYVISSRVSLGFKKKKKGLIRLLMADIKHQTTWLFGFIVVVIFFVSVQLLIFV